MDCVEAVYKIRRDRLKALDYKLGQRSIITTMHFFRNFIGWKALSNTNANLLLMHFFMKCQIMNNATSLALIWSQFNSSVANANGFGITVVWL